MNADGTLDLDLRQIVYVLSDALDYVGVDDLHHGKRVAFMARRTGEAAGWDGDLLDRVFHAGMVHDCGVSSTDEHRELVDHLDWTEADAHCRRGEALLASFPPLADLSVPVRHHHTHWADSAGLEITSEDRLLANCLYLVDRVDVLVAGGSEPEPLLMRGRIWSVLERNRGTRFAPELVDAFRKASEAEAFWFTLEADEIELFLAEIISGEHVTRMTPEELRSLATLFARIVDAKSPFTAQHSQGVARVARLLGEKAGVPDARRALLEVAALLHDLGKLRVPDAILAKPAPLDADERAAITHHSFHTYEILSRIDGFHEIAEWAAFHHEELSGSGYPFHKERGDLPLEARIVAVADVFQALAQDRPYREGMAPPEILTILREMVVAEKLDEGLVVLAADNLDACWRAALGDDAGRGEP